MDKIFKIGVFGLASNEQNALGSIFKLATTRKRLYALVAPQDRSSAEIILVDADDPNAMNEWRSFSVHHSHVPVIKVVKVPPTDHATEKYLRRPLTLKRVLEVLDDITIHVLGYAPEIVIGKESSEHNQQEVAHILDKVMENVPQSPRTGLKALVVDDAEVVRKSMEIHLRLFGMEIDFAETGEQALEFTQKHQYNIIFLDVMLPGVDGYQVCKKIKSHKLSKNTPVVMLTGKGSAFDKLKGTMAGANVYLTKPVEQDKLKETIEKLLPSATSRS